MATVATAPGAMMNGGPSNDGQGQQQQQRRSGCLKCGQMGHWARDCTATAEQIQQLKEMQERGEDGGELGAGANLQAPATGGGRRQRPKLTVDLLQESKGIPDVQENFYASMNAVFRGKGHEISDTRRLLELYKRWSDRVLPVTGSTETFDTFIAGVENFSTKAIVKDMLNMKRQDLLKRALNASMLDQPGGEAGDADADGPGDDDELLELAFDGNEGQGEREREGVGEGEGAGAGACEDDDDELLALAGVGAAPAEALCGEGEEEEEDEDPEGIDMNDNDLLDLMFDE